MKKFIIYIIPVLAVLTACNDLDKYPKDSVSSEVYFQDQSQLEQYSNQFYTLFPSAASMYNEVSDEIAIAELADEAKGTRIVPPDNGGTNWNWSMLRHINYLINHVDQCSDHQVALEYLGLAYFFRAYFYYDKVRHYGDVPWIENTLGNSDEQLYAARDSRYTVMEHVVSDLDMAINLLPADKSNVYRVNCYAARALKSRICLFEGTWRKYHGLDNWRPMLEEAYKAVENMLDEQEYKLYVALDTTQSYRQLFTMGTVTDCSEYILARCYNLDLKLYHNVSGFTISSTTGQPGFTKRFVNQYLNRDGSRYTDFADYKTRGIGLEMSDRDPRMEQTMLRPGHYVRIGGADTVQYDPRVSATGYQLIKYVMEKSTDTYNNSDCDMPLFRIAEVYLNYAEAKAELGELTQEDINKTINHLRRRALMPKMELNKIIDNPCAFMEGLYPNVSQDNKAVILEVRRERDIELVQEGFRYWDLMRWKEGKAFEQPYEGMSFAKVSNGEKDTKGFVDSDGNGRADLCAWTGVCPRAMGIVYLEVGKDIQLTNGINGGNIISNGEPGNLNNGRKWREDRDYLYPIPIQERVLTSGALSQNPGWDDGLTF